MRTAAFIFAVTVSSTTAAQEPPPPVDPPVASEGSKEEQKPAFDVAPVAAHLGKNVVVQLTSGAVIAGALVEVRREGLVVAVPFGASNVTREVRVAAIDIEALRLGIQPTLAPAAAPARGQSHEDNKVATERAWRQQQHSAALDAAARAEASARDHGNAAAWWYIGSGVFSVLGASAAGTWLFVNAAPLFAACAVVGCVIGGIAGIVGLVESNTEGNFRRESEEERRRAASVMAY